MCKECRQRPPNQLKINDRNIEALSKPNAEISTAANVGTSNAMGAQGPGSSNIPQPRRAATNQPQTTAGMSHTGPGMAHKQNQPQSQRNSRLENRPSLCRQQSECSEGTKKDENTKFRINQRTRIVLKKCHFLLLHQKVLQVKIIFIIFFDKNALMYYFSYKLRFLP